MCLALRSGRDFKVSFNVLKGLNSFGLVAMLKDCVKIGVPSKCLILVFSERLVV